MKILHTMLRVADLQQSIEFYVNVLGMRLLAQRDYPEGKFTLAYLGFAECPDGAQLELTYNWDTDHYEMGNAYGHIAIEVSDVYQATAQIEQRGGRIIRPAGPMNAGSTIIAFVSDPDGYEIELIGGS